MWHMAFDGEWFGDGDGYGSGGAIAAIAQS